ncbi:hypothetical protein C8J57DRAFT_1528048 [Mycena rebaudengoi]|nr:hypothetical protein C8J57DRAFT_1528048 [Mycena rebaudengoi]
MGNKEGVYAHRKLKRLAVATQEEEIQLNSPAPDPTSTGNSDLSADAANFSPTNVDGPNGDIDSYSDSPTPPPQVVLPPKRKAPAAKPKGKRKKKPVSEATLSSNESETDQEPPTKKKCTTKVTKEASPVNLAKCSASPIVHHYLPF